MELEKEIDRVLGAIMGGEEDPRRVLRDFAKAVRGDHVMLERLVPTCANCKERDALCFRCTVKEKIGEKALDSLPAIYLFVRQWYEQMKLERAAEAAAEAQRQAAGQQAAGGAARHGGMPRQAPPPPPGKQTF